MNGTRVGVAKGAGEYALLAKASALASSATPPSALGYPSPKGEAPKQAHSSLQILAGWTTRLRFAPRLGLFWGLTRVPFIS